MVFTTDLFARKLCYCLLLLFLTACAKQQYNLGKTAHERAILPLAIAESETKLWQTEYIEINYSLENDGSTSSLSGTLHIKDSVFNSFPLVEYFDVYINYLDENNNVIGSYDISPNFGYRKYIKDSYTLSNVPDTPAGAVSFVFSYWGNFTGRSSRNENTGDWEIYYSPFIKQ